MSKFMQRKINVLFVKSKQVFGSDRMQLEVDELLAVHCSVGKTPAVALISPRLSCVGVGLA
jgi:hypothetical protein